MDTVTLSSVFKTIVLRDGELILPFMGAAKLEDVPSSFSENGLVVTPPSRKLVFDNYSLASNDVLLNEYAKIKEISKMAAKRALYQDIDSLRETLEKKGEFYLEGFGTFRYDIRDGFSVETVPELELSAETFGLSTLDLREDHSSAKPEQHSDKALETNTVPKIEENTVQSLEENRNEDSNDSNDNKDNKDSEDSSDSEDNDDNDEWSESRGNGKGRGATVLLYFVLIVAILIILVLLIFIFKDSLMPILEKILYTQEELEILKYNL